MSGFEPGALVVIRSGDFYYPSRVHKVYKNGNFTLHGRPGEQWRPWGDGRSASRTGDRWIRESVFLRDEEMEREIAESRRAIRRIKNLRAVREGILRLREFEEDEAAVEAVAGLLAARALHLGLRALGEAGFEIDVPKTTPDGRLIDPEAPQCWSCHRAPHEGDCLPHARR